MPYSEGQSRPNMERPRPGESTVPRPSNTPYIISIVVMVVCGFGLIMTIVITWPSQDAIPLIGIIVGFLTSITVAILALMKGNATLATAQETHLSVNSRLDSFIKNAQDIALAQGRAEGLERGSREANLRTDALRDERTRDEDGDPPRGTT